MTRTTLYAATRGGPLVDDVRHWRVEVTPDGSLVLHEPGGAPRVVASPGQVARVVVVPSSQVGRRLLGAPLFNKPGQPWLDVLAFLGDDNVLLSMPFDLIDLGPSYLLDKHRTSGAADVALSLGLTLEPATESEISRVNAAPGVHTRGTTKDALLARRRVHLAAFAWLIACFAAMIVIGSDRDDERVTAVGIAMIPALMLLTVAAWRRSAAFVNQRPSAPDGRTVVPNVAGPDRWRWLREHQLQIGSHDIVVIKHVIESWLPGPARGGVVRCTVSEDTIWFHDRHDVALSAVPAELWVTPGTAPTALQTACDDAGIAFTQRQVEDIPPFLASDLDPAVYASDQALQYSITGHLERGAIFWGAGVFVVAFGFLASTIGAGSLIILSDLPTVLRAIMAAVAVIGLGAMAAMVIMYRHTKQWDRRQMETFA
ncbi:hypothetical protein [Aeromicrobium sp. CF3.5]|uniref:hypothetical protein n=1 Tax=Aeromicrobium sp. CF3.5 TaxID=3373078 RepID=UPI003EE64080